jgi:cellulose biosynthesis protein BcsQ
MTAFHRGVRRAARTFAADWVLVHVGPNLGATNRAALIAGDHVVIPLGSDLFSLQGLLSLGPLLDEWRQVWQELRSKSPDAELELSLGTIEPVGYVVMQHGLRRNVPPRAYQRWIDRFPAAYRKYVLRTEHGAAAPSADQNPHCL